MKWTKSKRLDQVRLLNRRLIGSTALKLVGFTVAYFAVVLVINVFFVSDIGGWIADHTSQWIILSVDEFRDFYKTQITNADLWQFQQDETYRVWARDLTIYRICQMLWPAGVIALYALGCMIIIVLALKRSINYFNELELAVEHLMDNRQESITLSHDLKITEDKLNALRNRTLEAEQESAEAETRKNALVAYLAHDVRTPLTSVIGYLHLLNDEPISSKASGTFLDDQTRKKYTRIALSKAESLENLVDELFEITRLNLSTMALDKTEIDLYLLCVQVAEELFPLAQNNSVDLSVNTGAMDERNPKDFSVVVDGAKLARALSNVVRNAITYAYPNTTVDITLESQHDRFSITISNVGPTIDPDHLFQVFERFYREDEARSSQRGGAGLGLAIAKEIIESHEGSISVSSADDLTTFTIELPVQQG